MNETCGAWRNEPGTGIVAVEQLPCGVTPPVHGHVANGASETGALRRDSIGHVECVSLHTTRLRAVILLRSWVRFVEGTVFGTM